MLDAQPHETLRSDNALPTMQRFMCHVDGAECDVIAAIMPEAPPVSDTGVIEGVAA